jgi:predicted nuclease of predicted toxin-antitoxin system
MEQLKDLLQQEGLLAEIFTKNILTPATLNYLQDNDPQKAFDYLINKIAKHIRNQVISKDMDFEAKRKALKEMVSDQYIKWDISVLSDDLKYVS